MSDENNNIISQFMSVTNASQDEAKSFLESSNNQLEIALNNYMALKEEEQSQPEQGQSSQTSQQQNFQQDLQQLMQEKFRQQKSEQQNKPSSAKKQQGPKIQSLGDLKPEQDSDDDNEDNEYYAGGEKSGQVVRGNPEGMSKQVQNLFEQLMQNQNRLNDSEAAQEQGVERRRINIYNNGIFTIDDGEPRSLRDPQNQAMLQRIQLGQIPEELEREDGGYVDIDFNRIPEDYKEQAKPKYKAFKGTKYTLGDASTSQEAQQDIPEQKSSTPQEQSNEASDSNGWEVDGNRPSTHIQLRLPDGQRVVVTINNDQSISRIRSFIRQVRPDIQGQYRFMTSFPQKFIEDETLTLEQAGLINSVLIVKIS